MLLCSLLTEMCTAFLGAEEVLNIINELTTTLETSTVTDFIRQPCCKKPVELSGNNPGEISLCCVAVSSLIFVFLQKVSVQDSLNFLL